MTTAPVHREVMPDLVRPRRLGRHTLSSALDALRALGVADDRVFIEAAGAGWTTGTVVSQRPLPGAPLPPATNVVLGVAGYGAMQALPYAMRDEDPEAFGADRLAALFDHESYRALAHLREAAGLFSLRAEDTIGARRFCEDLFLVSVDGVRPDRWFRLARLVPHIAQLAGRAEGLKTGVAFVTGVPVAAVHVRPTRAAETGMLAGTRLGGAALRLGVDAWLGPAVDQDRIDLIIEYGPMSVDTYFANATPAAAQERAALYALLLPSWAASHPSERWRVAATEGGTRLGGSAVVALGVNSYLSVVSTRSADG